MSIQRMRQVKYEPNSTQLENKILFHIKYSYITY